MGKSKGNDIFEDRGFQGDDDENRGLSEKQLKLLLMNVGGRNVDQSSFKFKMKDISENTSKSQKILDYQHKITQSKIKLIKSRGNFIDRNKEEMYKNVKN